ncbi:NAD-dependent succinate-semialdehyde dehydrogenase [Maritimibacter dapengensis]|uniref:NAD-dependent succinate-semialdehyde dehydrogenase n=1 Tax=Maritimibacter dapengensis TaxID=2836868 RepID=A0ABS6T065_9RHOB|nr:NAD-dependent succinate-semialdehyde dehydrogenase [Maritimibacter dapengensis]
MKDARTNQITTINPFTEEPIETYDRMSEADAMAAVEKCHVAHKAWARRSVEERAEVIAKIGKELREASDAFSKLMTEETGKLFKDGGTEIALCAAICDFTAKAAPDEFADEEREVQGATGVVTHKPLGVIYGIQPWNFPAYQAVRYSIASLIGGNGVILKHAANCTGSGLFLREVYERAGLPIDLFTVLVIDHDVSDKVIEHPLVRGVTLTGSDASGRKVAAKAGSVVKKTVLELGSNDAHIVLEDADLEKAVQTCVAGRVYNNGQTCVSAKRFIVEDSIYDEFVAAYVDAMKGMTTGDPMENGTALGPIARKDLRDDLHKQVTESVAQGAKVEIGGEVPEGKGYFYPATVLTNVQPGQPAYDDELFGPVAAIIRAKDEADAVRIANDSRYGLGGGVHSGDTARARRIALEELDTGMVYVNGFNVASPNMPFGGVKDSGYGREHGGFGMKEFVNTKSVFVN